MTHPPRSAFAIGRKSGKPARVGLRLEALEDRTLLSAPAPVPAYDPTHILVQFRAGVPPVLNLAGAVLGPQLHPVPGLYEVSLAGLSVPAAAALLRADPRVLSTQPDYYMQVSGTPNDPQFSQEWGMLNTGQNGGTAGFDVGATQAWNVTTGGPGVTFAEIDTGIDYNNADLYKNIWINQAEIPDQWFTKSADGTFDAPVHKAQVKTATAGVITFADLNNPLNKGLVWDGNGDGRIDAGDLLRPLAQGGWDGNGQDAKDGDTAHPDDFFGWNFVNDTNNPFDDNGHGTNVAGIMGATGNDGVGVAGLDWQMPLMDLKVFTSGGIGSVSGMIQAIDYSIRHGAKITNNSWVLNGPSPDLFNAIGDAQKAGQIFVVAAGNGGSSQPSYPALYTPQLNNIVSVAAITNTGQLWSNSDYGATTVTLAAPGVNIVSTAPGGGFVSYTGTSQAVPFVTGTLALVWGQHPTWTYQQVIAQVTSTVTPLAGLKGKTITGGLVNAAAAVGAIPGGVHAPVHVVSAGFSGPDAYSLNRVLVTFDQIIDPTTLTASKIHLKNPAGSNVPLTVKLAPGSDGRQYEIDFAVQTAAGKYVLSIDAGVLGRLGGALGAFTTSTTLAPPPTTVTFSSTAATPIPANGTVVSSITVGQSFAVAAVKVQVNITAAQDGPLYLFVQAPNGTQVLLALGRGGAGQNYVNTIFADGAATAIGAGAAPFAGSYRPEIPLSIFNGMNAAGAWKLTVQNRSGQVVGVLNSWSLIFTPASNAVAAGAMVAGEEEGGSAGFAAADAAFTTLGAGWRS